MSNTITMNGDSTGYGASFGNESFVLNGYQNNVLLGGANDSVALAGGGEDTVNLNYTGFTNAVTDTIDLGQGVQDSILAGHALQGSAVSIANGYGATTLSLVNHGGSTVLDLGNLGDAVNQGGLGLNDLVTLNGDASNSVSFQNGDGAQVTIGAAGDRLSAFASTVALNGVYNTVLGGDENFTVTDQSGLNTITLGNGNNTLSLGGDLNHVQAGNGSNKIFLSGAFNTVSLGDGNNTIESNAGTLRSYFATGGAGASETLALSGNQSYVQGGDENFAISSTHGGAGVILGDGNNSVSLAYGGVTLGSSTANTGVNSVTLINGGSRVALFGGTSQVALMDVKGGFDQVKLDGTKLGTALTAHGSFDSITLTSDANAAITETAVNGGLQLTIDGDATGGIGAISVTGLAHDDLAQISLVGLGTYTVSVDNTPMGGLTLHFAHGSIDLIGEQSISNHLITG